jgi:hypothetical protein
MGQTAILGWQWPDLPATADTPEGFLSVAKQVEATMADKTLTEFVPRWVAIGAYQPSNPVINIGFFRYARGLVDVAIYQYYGPATSGGSGDLAVELPMPTAWPHEQWLTAKTYIPGYGRAIGLGVVNARQVIQPLFPISAANVGLRRWRSTVDPIAPGTGVPQVAGAYSVRDGANLAITGRYRVVAAADAP